MSGPYLYCLVSQTKLVTPSELFRICEPLEQCAQQCADAWGKARPAIVALDNFTRLSTNPTAIPVIFIDDDSDPTAIAFHTFDPFRPGPAATVYVNNASGFNTGVDSVVEATSHEILEALIDPTADLWSDHPTRPGVQVALEVSDPVQTSFKVQALGTDWQVANFVTPQWFDKRYVGGGAGLRFDHSGELARPGDVGPEGYLILRDATGRVWYENAHGEEFGSLRPTKAQAIRRNGSRTQRRGVVLPALEAA